MGVSVRSRAHRILKDLYNYRDISDCKYAINDTFIGSLDKSKLIGIYENEDESYIIVAETTLILITNKKHERKTIEYKEIQKINLPENKRTGEIIRIEMTDDTIVKLPVQGSKGRFKDIFGFSRFISRVISDLKR